MNPTLLILAAGMGSRYGGLKQLDEVGPHKETIMDYSIYDAIRAGFGQIVFVIREDFKDDFATKVLSKYRNCIKIETVFQSLENLPEGFHCPAERIKPWGTNHAVLMGKEIIKEPFAVINADDFYGQNSFEIMGKVLSQMEKSKNRYCMVGYPVQNTLSESGPVSRGVCTIDKDHNLTNIVERTDIIRNEHAIQYKNTNGNRQTIETDTIVSMNMWGFTPDYFDYSLQYFTEFLRNNITDLKVEYYIPTMVNQLINTETVKVKVYETDSEWFGVTYPQDRPVVVEKLARLIENGIYPSKLFQ
jgi:UTP-glucose-1-phosphate uridylyltransferase